VVGTDRADRDRAGVGWAAGRGVGRGLGGVILLLRTGTHTYTHTYTNTHIHTHAHTHTHTHKHTHHPLLVVLARILEDGVAVAHYLTHIRRLADCPSSSLFFSKPALGSYLVKVTVVARVGAARTWQRSSRRCKDAARSAFSAQS
jgi:hypothetical protein